jgi:arylsulfatase
MTCNLSRAHHALRITFVLFALGAACGGCGTGTSALPDVIVISLDTTRSDHIGAYGSRVQTPAIDRVAAEGVIFEKTSAACTTTLPSHVSLLTGRWPIHHGVPRNGYTVNDQNVMLPEILQAAGYRTIGVSAAVALSKLLNFPQGFDHWDQDPETFEDHEVANTRARRASEITDATLSALADSGEQPRFLFVHYVDPHAPYTPPEKFRAMYIRGVSSDRGSYASIREAQDEHQRAAGAKLGPAATNRLTRELIEGSPRRAVGDDRILAALYAGEITYMDQQLGRLLDELRRQNLYDDALIVITADHGETFWEHADVWSHGVSAYQTAVSVPMIVRFPRGEFGGKRVRQTVSQIDLLPTLLEYLGLETDAAVDGKTLLPLLRGERDAHQPAFSQGPLPGGVVEKNAGRWLNARKPNSLRVGRWKLVSTPYLGLEELFDLNRDPMEQQNILASDDIEPEVAEVADSLRTQLREWLANADPLPSEFFPRTRPLRPGMADEQLLDRRRMWERLRELGYVSEEDEAPAPE